MRTFGALVLAAALAIGGSAQAQSPPRRQPQEANGYTRYELLAPGSGKFRIIYDITAVRPGVTAFFNPIRKGSVASDESVTDLATGQPLKFAQVSGESAKTTGLPEADAKSDYIRVELAHPVPADGGEARILIEKTYEDAKSYYVDGADLVFDRGLGIKKNAVVLPKGYVLVSCNYPSQVAQEADGRLRVSFYNITPGEAPLKLRAAPGVLSAAPTSVKGKFGERAKQTRDVVYFLQPPETHAFDLYHDYTEEKAGVSRYINVVRTGSVATNPSARNLDTGEAIAAVHLKGDEITKAGIEDPQIGKVTPQSEVVVFNFKPLKAGQSIRLRMSETYTDPGRYRLVGDELVFDRTFGRAENAVVLPKGWMLTNSSFPVVVSRTEDGRIRLDFNNPRPDEVEALFTAKKVAP
ncbi:MAG TPA: hypothetical protein VNW53_19750 [Phenylobacterium sp.]|jgi:hypothetical protein|uniref:hypothetical protein n=1 Tax=Phenylobacterium sp. TaxID=1871053 RepID=UPI002CBE9958|nr:hypothetical protein [Phenylobacterium sp.]HXA41246.1 hypothetical protein [Phenylobacterium sp.]